MVRGEKKCFSLRINQTELAHVKENLVVLVVKSMAVSNAVNQEERWSVDMALYCPAFALCVHMFVNIYLPKSEYAAMGKVFPTCVYNVWYYIQELLDK